MGGFKEIGNLLTNVFLGLETETGSLTSLFSLQA
jgi:hypothetical protein